MTTLKAHTPASAHDAKADEWRHQIIAPMQCPVCPTDPCGDSDCPACGNDLYHRAIYRMLQNLSHNQRIPTRAPDRMLPGSPAEAFALGQSELLQELLCIGDDIRRTMS